MSINAGLGIASFNFEEAKGFWKWVSLCEEGGINSIWQSDRIIDSTPNLEVMSVMAALAGATKKIKFGMNAASLGLRDPVLIAKACATIDILSEGRLLPVFAVGSALSRDYSATGKATKGRGKRTDEGLQVISRLWTEDRVDFVGDYYQLEKATINPKPVQNPMPLWVGGSAEAAIERTARWGTGWQAGIETAAEIQPVILRIKERCAELDREIDEDHFGAGFAVRFGSHNEPIVSKYNEIMRERLGKDPKEYSAIGDADTMLELLKEFHEAGAHKFILRPIADGHADMIHQTKLLIEELMPRIAKLNNED